MVIIEKKQFIKRGGVIFQYKKTETIIDEDNNRKIEYEYKRDPFEEYGNYTEKLTYALDAGKLLEHEYTDSDQAKYTFTYNENNDLLTEEKTNKNGKVRFLENYFNEDGTISYQTRKDYEEGEYVLKDTYKFTLNDCGFIQNVEILNASGEYIEGFGYEYGLNEVPFKGKEEQRPLGVGNYDGNYLLTL